MPVERFRSKEAYRKNLAYRHIHGIPMTATRVIVSGKEHRVGHSRENAERKRINAAQRRKVARRRTYVRHNRVFHRRHERG